MTRQKFARFEASKVLAAGVDRRMVRPVTRIRVASAIDEEWADPDEVRPEMYEMEEDVDMLEQELSDDEIDVMEEGFVRGYRRERARRYERGEL